MRFLVLALTLLLAGCAGGGPNGSQGPTLPPPVSAPPAPIERPGSLVFSASWTNPLGAALQCEGIPIECDLPPDALWGVLPQAGTGGSDCPDPEPNVCFQPVDGVLGYRAGSPGMALISARTMPKDKPFSIEAVVTVNLDCSGDVAYMGPVPYDSEGAAADPDGTYRSLYVSCAGPHDPIQLWLYGPTYAGPIGGYFIAQGSTHALGIDWIPGVSITYKLDGAPIFTETPGLLSNDPVVFARDWRPALWFGNAVGSVGKFDVYAP